LARSFNLKEGCLNILAFRAEAVLDKTQVRNSCALPLSGKASDRLILLQDMRSDRSLCTIAGVLAIAVHWLGDRRKAMFAHSKGDRILSIAAVVEAITLTLAIMKTVQQA
jgi:hypothetical protein